VTELEVLIRELRAVDGLPSGAVAVGEVTTLDHEALDDTVECRALIAEALLATRESAEVLSSLGDCLAVKPDDDAPQGLVAMGDVKVGGFIRCV